MSEEKKDSTYTIYSPSTTNEALMKLTSKIVPRKKRYVHNSRAKKDTLTAPDKRKLEAVSRGIATDIADISAITEMLPEIERAMSILESAVLSPKDLMDPELMIRLRGDIESPAAGPFINIVTDILKKKYSLDAELPTILRDALHRTGSYIYAVLPESSVDAVINGESSFAVESVNNTIDVKGTPRPLGLLGHGSNNQHTASFATESLNSTRAVNGNLFKMNEHISVFDNYDVLKYQILTSKRQKMNVMSSLLTRSSFATESNTVSKMLDRKYQKTEFSEIKGLSGIKKTTGGPLVLHLPSESTIPVHVSGNPKDHVGYFVLLDDRGSPLTIDATGSQYAALGRAQQSEVSNIVTQTRTALGIKKTHAKDNSDSFGTFTDLVERDLKARLKNGAYTDDMTIASDPVVYRIMLARALEQKKTSLLFLPAELVTYFAFGYDSKGVGKSRLIDSKILASMRSVLLFSNMAAAVKNSTALTKLVIELDPEDDDPESTVNDIIEEYLKTNMASTPAGSTLSATDITKFLQRQSITVEVSGNEKYPGTKLSIDDHQRNVPETDSTLDENLSKRIFMKMGLSPEIVDSSFDSEFATTVLANNLLLSKLASGLQKPFLAKTDELIRKLVLFDGDIMSELIDAIRDVDGIKSDEVEELVYELVHAIETTLPSAENSKFSTQIEAYVAYRDALEETIGAYLNEDMIADYLDTDLADGIAPAIEACKAYFLRAWLERENVMPELINLSDIGGDGFDLSEMHTNLIEGAVKNFGDLFRKLRKVDRNFERNIDKDTTKDENAWEEQDSIEEEKLAAEEAERQAALDDENASVDPVDDSTDVVDEVTSPESTENPGDGAVDFNFDLDEIP